ncbi:hypothetical protein HDV03_002427 [Kappamyces sp. JEL0829]|nr:hypothetical protein HDV03_002427 [Kappamyces sp. JEL0829]
MRFLIQFRHKHQEFRIPELESLSLVECIPVVWESGSYCDKFPFLVVEIESVEKAKKIIRRSLLIKSISELWAEGDSQDELFDNLRQDDRRKRPEYQHYSFKFLISSFGYSLSLDEQRQRIDALAFLELPGKIDLSSPDVEFVYHEVYHANTTNSQEPAVPVRLYYGVHVASGTGNELWQQYDLKKRTYLGTTSMDAELSLITANLALAKPGAVIIDPFVGTGSFLVACSHFGAFTLGSDIDGRKIRGSENGGIASNLLQYKLESLVLGTMASDFAHHPWRRVPLFDAIVCDPPYGVREGAKKITYSNLSPFKKYNAAR